MVLVRRSCIVTPRATLVPPTFFQYHEVKGQAARFQLLPLFQQVLLPWLSQYGETPMAAEFTWIEPVPTAWSVVLRLASEP